MAQPSQHWHELTPSQFAWEREALDFVKKRFPATPAHRVWTNFEFIAGDGSINEVDMLAVTPRGVFLVEIKSWPERIEGDQGTWYRVSGERRQRAEDNPRLLTNRKAKRLKSLLESTASGRKGRLPFVEALVFLSHPDVQPRLDRAGRLGVTVRDAEGEQSASGGLPGIVGTLTTITAEDHGRRRFRPLGMRDAELVASSLESAGIQESRRHRRVGDYDLIKLIDEGPGYQEYAARHASLPDTERRIRIFTSSSGLEREVVVQAAKREFRSLDSLEHPGILTPRDYVEHELGPALIYDREPDAITLDHYLAIHGARLDFEARLALVRTIAEALAYAHARGVIHRALSPRGILVSDPSADHPRLRIRDWHTAQRAEVTGNTNTTQTGLLEQLVPAAVELYLAPESPRSRTGEHLDVFSLGAIAFHVFAGAPPSDSLIERQAHLDRHGGLDIGSVVDGAPDLQRVCVLTATCPDVSHRTESVKAFLAELDEIEGELTEPATDEEIDPTTAGKGDGLLDYKIEARLGSGASSVAYLITEEGEQRVLKVAIEPARNENLRSEAAILARVRAAGIVRLYREDLAIAGHEAIVIEYAGEETLAERIRREGPLGLELLERLGEDLLRSVSALEDQGVYHRDIKPANIGIGRRGRSSQLRLVLFDFSLSQAPLDAIAIGTPAYLDPFLAVPSRGRFDLHAERFAAAMTLHEMATGQLPRWGDGLSDPAAIDAEVSIEPDLLGSVGEPLAAFFRRALARSTAERFDTAEEMLRAWRDCFHGADKPVVTDHGVEPGDGLQLKGVSGATATRELALSPRAQNALERAGIATVSALVETPEFDLRSLPGVGAGTRGELVAVAETLRDQLADEEVPDVQGLDLLARQLVPRRSWDEADLEVVRVFLGVESEPWLGVGAVAEATGRDRADVQAVLDRARERWAKSLRSVTRLRDEIDEMLAREGGVLPSSMLEEGVLARRGAVAAGEERIRLAAASARAAIETEMRRESPRFATIRVGDVAVAIALPAVDPDAARTYLEALGSRAVELVADGPVDRIRAEDEIDAVPVPDGMPAIPGARLVRLAAAIGVGVEANDRGELYPVGMSAELALRRVAGSFSDGAALTLEEVEARLRSRYPHAGPTPPRERIDEILVDFGMDWDAGAARYQARSSALASSHFSSDLSTTMPSESRSSFEQRLDRSRDRFLALTAHVRRLVRAEQALSADKRVTAIALDAALIDHMEAIAAEKHATWEAVLGLDAGGPESRGWRILADLVDSAAVRLRDQLLSTSGTVLASRPGLLARYGQLGVLEEVRRQVDDSSYDTPLKGLWLLVPTGDGPPVIEGTPWPVIDENEWAQVPSDWVRRKLD